MESHTPQPWEPALLTASRRRSVGASRFGRTMIAGACAVLALAACGSGAGAGNASDSASPAASSPSSSMQPTGTLRVGVDIFPPHTIQNGDQFSGSEIDMARAIGEKLNMNVEIQKLGFDTLIPSLQADRIDMTLVGGWADGEKRRASMNMVAYFVAHSGLLVKKGDTTHSLAELCGKKVSTLTASVYVPVLEDASKACTEAGKQEITILALDQDGAVLALKSGQSDARMDEGATAGFIAKNDPDLQMNTLTDFETFNGSMGMALDKVELAQKVAAAMDELRAEGKLAEIFNKYGIPADWLVPKVTLNGQ
jgi:polar amino acid transport system substrate-binding protein